MYKYLILDKYFSSNVKIIIRIENKNQFTSL